MLVVKIFKGSWYFVPAFIDQTQLNMQSGKGGDGMMHFLREKYKPFGGPDGGDGGKGGDVVLEVDKKLNTLLSLRNQRVYRADDGKRGGTNNKTGRSGDDLVIKVPAGTIVYEETGDIPLGDLINEGQRLMICKGGRGGRGNTRFASSRNKAPRLAEKGEPSRERVVKLELKLIADIGIVGVPNAGKSTLLSVVTNAKPKIADYPFTTITPNLGVADLDEYNSIVLADLPGLIEGAHQGVGLGHDFLRHVQRTRVLIHLLDGMAEDPIADFAQINSELALFDSDLANKPQIIALTKMDLPDVQERWPEIEKKLIKRGYKPLNISAVANINVRELLFKAAKELSNAPVIPQAMEIPVYRPEEDPREYTIIREEAGWRVKGVSVERAAAMTYWEYEQSVRRFQRILEAIGIDKELREMGIVAGDLVLIGEFELEWEE